jgi:hypothetical protein
MSIYEEIAKKLDELHEKIRPDNIDEWLDDVRKTTNIFLTGEKISHFRKTLESVEDELKKDSSKKEQLKRVYGLINSLKSTEPDFLIERLKTAGWSIANPKDNNNEEKSKKLSLRKAINGEALRLLEQTRLGKRDIVIGMLMRDFTTKKVKFPPEFVEASKQKYDVNHFRAFMYAFLSNFTTEKTETKEGSNE